MRKLLSASAMVALICTGLPSQAAGTYFGTLLASNEVGSTGAVNAVGTALAVIDVAGKVDVTFSFTNLAANLTGAHIHRGVAGVNGPVIIDFNPPSIGDGPGIFTFATSVVDPDAFEITNANASGYYFNLHSSQFPGGAIRGQLMAAVPEPETYALMMLGLAAVGVSVRRRAQAAAS